jgi:hypothetical protein
MNSPFDNFIQEMLGNRNPQGNMLTGVSTTPNFYTQAQNNDYYNNPFRKQDSIDAAMAKKLADEQALAQQLGVGGGMMSGGGDSPQTQLTADQIAYFDAETDMERDARINNIFSGIVAPIAGLLGGPVGYGLGSLVPNNAPVYSGRDDYSTRSPALIQQQVQAQAQAAAQQQAYAEAMNRASISYDSNAYSGGGGFTNSEGNAPGASYGEVGDSAFSGDVGYDQ